MSSKLKFLFLLVFLFFAGCQAKKPLIIAPQSNSVDHSAEWQKDRQKFESQQPPYKEQLEWFYSAKVGIRSEQLREQANLIWRFRDQSNEVRLFGPFGAGAVKLEFDQYGVRLSDSKGLLYEGDSAESLLTEITGWPLPIDALSYWLFVKPAPEATFEYNLNEDGLVDSIRQLGWLIEYQDYRMYSDRLLPRKLTASKMFNDKQQGLVTVKLVTKSWQMGDE